MVGVDLQYQVLGVGDAVTTYFAVRATCNTIMCNICFTPYLFIDLDNFFASC